MRQGCLKASEANTIKSTVYSGNSSFKKTKKKTCIYVTSLIAFVIEGEIIIARRMQCYVRSLFLSFDLSDSTVSSNLTCGL